jgi:hypothetical protein
MKQQVEIKLLPVWNAVAKPNDIVTYKHDMSTGTFKVSSIMDEYVYCVDINDYTHIEVFDIPNVLVWEKFGVSYDLCKGEEVSFLRGNQLQQVTIVDLAPNDDQIKIKLPNGNEGNTLPDKVFKTVGKLSSEDTKFYSTGTEVMVDRVENGFIILEEEEIDYYDEYEPEEGDEY